MREVSRGFVSYSDELLSNLRQNNREGRHKYNVTISCGPQITRMTIVVGLHHVTIPILTEEGEFQHLRASDFTSKRNSPYRKGKEIRFPLTQVQLELLLSNHSLRTDIYHAYNITNMQRYNRNNTLKIDEVINLIRRAFTHVQEARIRRKLIR